MDDFIEVTTKLYPWTCSCCNITIALPAGYIERRWKDGKKFFCPNRCEHEYDVEMISEADRLQRMLESVKRERDSAREQKNHEERRNASLRGHVTRLKKRQEADAAKG